MVELDQFKYTLSTYETPLKEVRDSLNLEAKIRRIDERGNGRIGRSITREVKCSRFH